MSRAPIDFGGLAAALLDRAHLLVPQWLPAGAERNGRWYVGDFDGSPGESANVNMATGQWIDNAAPDEDKGGDLISLYARIRGLNNGQAAREVMRDMGWATDDDKPHTPWRAPEPPPATPAPAGRPKRWRAVVPVPAHAPEPKFVFAYKDSTNDTWVEHQAVRTWRYRFNGQLFGYVARIERVSSDGELVKDTVARTWCENLEDQRGTQCWHWKQWEAPRPLYVPAEALADGRPVVLVEGEKCAEAGHQLLGSEFDFVSWPGGCKAWKLADWRWLAGRTVYLWPDCDAQCERLNRAEREAGASPDSKPVLPEHKQPGVLAMRQIGSLLAGEQGCVVHWCQVPAPGTVADGWDIADAIAEGWDAERARAFILAAAPLVPPAEAPAGAPPPPTAGAGQGGAGGGRAGDWRMALHTGPKGAVLAARENVVLALDGMALPDGGWLPGIPEAEGVIAFNDFTNDVLKLRATPWGTPAGVWDECDELELGDWLSRSYNMPPMSRQTLEEAVSMVSRRHRYHPARDRIERLRGTWDNTQRLRIWLARVCRAEGLPRTGEAADDVAMRLHDGVVGDALGEYLACVGRWMMMAICARVITPGCKFDYMPILEGGQGLGKSTLARVLGGDWFADTGLVLGDKDSYQNLQGVLVYEWGELDSLTRSEVTKVKQFISSQKDRFRASFDRRPKDYPRQVVFIGTTNESHYLSDPTGNRRFWPVRVTRQIDLAWLRDNVEQLFAEALHYLDQGKRFHPNQDEQRRLFDPQQLERTVENALESAIRRYLYDETQKSPIMGVKGTMIDEVTLADLLSALQISVDKQTQVLTKQASAALGRMGWERGRASGKGGKVRPWVYRRPAEQADRDAASASHSSTGRMPAEDTERAADACPF